MSAEEVLFDYILSGLIINERKIYKKLAKQLLKKKKITTKKYYGEISYQYSSGTTNILVVLEDLTELNHHISHPVRENKWKEIQECVYDLAWLDAQVLKYLNLRSQPSEA